LILIAGKPETRWSKTFGLRRGLAPAAVARLLVDRFEIPPQRCRGEARRRKWERAEKAKGLPGNLEREVLLGLALQGLDGLRQVLLERLKLNGRQDASRTERSEGYVLGGDRTAPLVGDPVRGTGSHPTAFTCAPLPCPAV